MISDRSDAHFHFFYGRESLLSNWSMQTFVMKNVEFVCREQAMMFCKAKLFGDEVHAKLIMQTDDPAQHKRYGRAVQGFSDEIWDKYSEHYVYQIVLACMRQNVEARSFLLETGNRVIAEASKTDAIWGIGLAITDPKIWEQENWIGCNKLGKAHMRVRNTLEEC